MSAAYSEIRELLALLRKPHPQTVEVIMGVVESVETTTCTIQLPGAPAGIPGFHWLIDAYDPVVGHTVMILKNGPDKFILGRTQ